MKSTLLPIRIACYLFVLAASLASLRADLTGPHLVEWKKSYTGPGNGEDQATATAVDSAGNVVVTGYTYNTATGYDYYTAKYAAATGALIWEKRYNDVTYNNSDLPSAIAVDASGNVIVTGSSEGNGTGQDYYTAKYAAADGALLWEKRYNGTGPEVQTIDEAKAVALDASGNVIVTGSSTGVGVNKDFYTAKYSAVNGSLLWEKRFNGSSNGEDEASAIAVDASGNVIVTGYSYSATGENDYYTAKYAAATGALIWQIRYNGTGNSTDVANAVAVDASGNVIVTGSSWNNTDGYDYYTAKYAAATGALIWAKRYTKTSFDEAYALAVDTSGNVIVTGYSSDVTGYRNCHTLKYAAANGALLWERRYNPANIYSQANAIGLDASGNVVVTGSATSATDIGMGFTDYYTAKYAAADGALLWEKLYNGTGDQSDVANALALDAAGNVVVTGQSFEANGTVAGNDFYTAKLDSATGALLWNQRYNSPSYTTDVVKASAVDTSGNLIVTGYSDSLSEGQGYYTAKYAAVGGALIWEKRYDYPDPGSGPHEASAIALDASGNVIVTGYALGTAGTYDYYTAKYAAADGALLWEKRYNGAAINDDRATAIAVDASGNVIVTGYSKSTAGNFDYYTAKYAAATGVLLWEKRYSSSGANEDKAAAVAVDASGNVFVTGSSRNTTGFTSYHTLKYASADGAQLWTKRYTSNLYSEATAIAVDSAGNAIVTGNSSSSETGNDCYTVKYAAADGAILWSKRSDGDDYAGANAVALDANGNVIITGISSGRRDTDGGSISTGFDYYTVKYAAATGATLWEKRNAASDSDDESKSLAVDTNGNVVVTGYSTNADSTRDVYTAAYAAADGALLWDNRTAGVGHDNSTSSGNSVKLDTEGNAFVSGSVFSPLTGPDYLAMKFVPATKIIGLGGNMAFGDVIQGKSKTAVLTISNTGNVPLTIASIDYPSGFSGSFSGSIPPGGSQQVTVTFSPTLVQAYTGNITVVGDQTSGTNTLALSGNGIPVTKIIGLSGNMVFGNVAVGATKTSVLTLSNTGNSPLTVSSISYPAGFSGAFSGVIPPAGSQTVTVTFSPTAIQGYSGSLSVVSDALSGISSLAISGTSVTRILGLSGNMAFGSVPVGSTKTGTLTISNTGNSSLTVTGITYPAGFSGAYTGTIAAGSSANVTVTFSPAAVQSYSGHITVATNRTSGTNTRAISGTGIAASRIIGLSGDMNFGVVSLGATKTAVLTLSNTGNSPLAVSSITYPAGFSGAFAGVIPVGGSQTATVTFTPTLVKAYTGNLSVVSDKTSGTNTLALTGTGFAPTRIIALSGTITFGDTPLGLSKTLVLNILNMGNFPLNVTGIVFPAGMSGAFAGTIPPGVNQNVTVTFSPTTLQTVSSNITVLSDKTSGTNTRTASGTGIAATRIIGISGNGNFGSVAVGATKTSVLTITNTGNSPLNLTGVSYPAGFSGFLGGSIAPGASITATVTFKPTAAKSYNGDLTLTSDATSGTTTFPFTASGT